MCGNECLLRPNIIVLYMLPLKIIGEFSVFGIEQRYLYVLGKYVILVLKNCHFIIYKDDVESQSW